MPSLSIRAAFALVLLASAASAAERPPLRLQGEREPGEERGLVNVFISPAGQPFRAKPGEPYPVYVWFHAADRNGDGKLTLDEFRQDADAFFAILDTDHDGMIDGFEISDYERKVAPEILPRIAGLRFGEGMDPRTLGEKGRGGDDGGGRRGRAMAGDRQPQGAGIYSMVSDPEPVSAADGDLSGKITKDEWHAIATRRFELLDKMKLGYLTLATLPKTPIQTILERPVKKDGKRPPPR